MKHAIKPLILAILLAVGACATGPIEIEEDLAPREYFQRAQEAAGTRSDYNTALAYYNAFIERYPDDSARVVEAEYEIAFIHYVQGDVETAESEFRALLRKYEQPGAEVLPKWPRVLAQKLLTEIEIEKENADDNAATAAE